MKSRVVDATAYTVYFIQTANSYDVQGIGYVYGTCTNPQYLRSTRELEQESPDSGKPVASNMAIVLFGGTLANGYTSYYERNAQAPLLFTMTAYGSGLWGFVRKDGSSIPDAYLDMGDFERYQGHADLFIVETFIDSEGNFVVVMYGITQWGTLAAGSYFHETMLPEIENFLGTWYIFGWNDGTNGQPYDGLPQPGEITLVASDN